jgi:hypothetical protein
VGMKDSDKKGALEALIEALHACKNRGNKT